MELSGILVMVATSAAAAGERASGFGVTSGVGGAGDLRLGRGGRLVGGVVTGAKLAGTGMGLKRMVSG